jgi:hypothetical protein
VWGCIEGEMGEKASAWEILFWQLEKTWLGDQLMSGAEKHDEAYSPSTVVPFTSSS